MRAMTGVVLALAMASVSGAAMAQTLAWQVTEVSGAVTIRHGTEEHPAVRGAMLQPGDGISTGAGARAVMVHEKDFVTLAGRSRATVPGTTQQASGFTKLLQDLGNAVYKIEKRGVPHFGVTTPYLAAVVKGTTFSITVDERGSTLQVVEGAVEVATPDGGARDLILPAGVASVSAADRLRLTVHGDSDRVIDSPARGTTGTGSGGGDAAGSGAPASPTVDAPPSTAQASAAVESRSDVILVPVASRPVDMAAFTGGLVTGTAGFTVLTASTTQAIRTASAIVALAAPAVAPVPVAQLVAAPTVTATIAPAVIPAATVAVATPAVTPATTPAVITPVLTPVATPAVTTPAVTTPAVIPAATVAVVTPAATPATTPAVVTPVLTPVATPAVITPVVTPVTTTAVVTPVTTPLTTPVGTVTVVAPVVVTVTTPVVTTIVTPITTPVVTMPVVTAPIVLPVIPVIKDELDDDGESGKGKGNNGNHYGWTKGKG